MRAKTFALILLALSLGAGPVVGQPVGDQPEKFAVYYADKEPVSRFKDYNVLVLSEGFPAVQPLAEQGKLLLGYVSLGEIEKGSPFYDAMKKQGLLIKENGDWRGSFLVDIRADVWQRLVIEEFIPKILRGGFSGVFFDTLDGPLELEREKPETYRGMSENAINLLHAVRMHFPALKIMVNRAYSILPQVASVIDMELGESVFADYDFNKKTYGKVGSALYEFQVKALQDARNINPQLKIYTLDYANPRDTSAIRDIYRTQRANGFTPYVATVKLDELIDEPGNP